MQNIESYVTEPEVIQIMDGDIVVNVKKHLPYRELEDMAFECVERCYIVDSDTGIAFSSYRKNLILVFLQVKYYTDIDVSNQDTPEGMEKLYDFLNAHGLVKPLEDIMLDESISVEMLVYDLMKTLLDKEKTVNSLGYKLGKAFGSLLGGDDIVETVAKSEVLNNKLVEMFGVFKEHEKENAVLDSTKNTARLKVGGAKQQLAKK